MFEGRIVADNSVDSTPRDVSSESTAQAALALRLTVRTAVLFFVNVQVCLKEGSRLLCVRAIDSDGTQADTQDTLPA